MTKDKDVELSYDNIRWRVFGLIDKHCIFHVLFFDKNHNISKTDY